MSEQARPSSAKIKPLASLLPVRALLRRAGRKVVFTNGHFDLMHPGHVRYLQFARSCGDCLLVGLNGDASTRRRKGPGRPIMGLAARSEVLAALGCVDYVVTFEEDTAEQLVRTLQPDVYVKGGDYVAEAGKPLPEAAIVNSYGGHVVLAPLVAGFSTTDLIREIVSRFGESPCRP